MVGKGDIMAAHNTCHNLLLTSLTAYYQKRPAFRQVLFEIVEGLSPLSLRIIDWFVTHYARTHPVMYWIDDEKQLLHETYPPDGGAHLRNFSLYLDYRAQLKSYTKLYMDSFRRHQRITFVLETHPLTTMETTVGQLNFFRWALSNHVIEYILAHLPEIESNMTAHQKESKHSLHPHIEREAPTRKGGDGFAPTNTVMHAPCFVRFD